MRGPMHSNIVPVPARRHPHQVLMAALLMVSGLSVLAGGVRPGSLSAALPVALVYVWAVVVTVGAALVVAAAIVRPLAALFLELAADPSLAVMCLVYSAAALSIAGWRAVVPVALLFGVAVAFAVRAVQVYRTLSAVRRELRRE